jgi:hypothetical protein
MNVSLYTAGIHIGFTLMQVTMVLSLAKDILLHSHTKSGNTFINPHDPKLIAVLYRFYDIAKKELEIYYYVRDIDQTQFLKFIGNGNT